jgi:hypothetical protein
VGELWRRAEAWLRRRSLDRDLEEELSFHLDMKVREVGNRAAARRALGSPLLLRERAREAWGWQWLDDMLWDIRYALRQFRQHPGFTAVAVLTLALGIGVNATVFTITNAMLFNGFPHVDLDNRIRYIGTRSDAGLQSGGVSYPDFEDWRTQTTSFDGLAVVGNGGLRLLIADHNGSPEIYDGTQDGVTTASARAEMETIGRRLERSYPSTNHGFRPAVMTFGRFFVTPC